jgi:hypothetical protein
MLKATLICVRRKPFQDGPAASTRHGIKAEKRGNTGTRSEEADGWQMNMANE